MTSYNTKNNGLFLVIGPEIGRKSSKVDTKQ